MAAVPEGFALLDHLAEQAEEALKSCYNLECLGIRQAVKEREFESQLIDKLRDFIIELGYGFRFFGRQRWLSPHQGAAKQIFERDERVLRVEVHDGEALVHQEFLRQCQARDRAMEARQRKTAVRNRSASAATGHELRRGRPPLAATMDTDCYRSGHPALPASFQKGVPLREVPCGTCVALQLTSQ